MEGDRPLYISRHCVVEENAFPMKKGTSIIRVKNDDLDDLKVNADDGFIFDDLID